MTRDDTMIARSARGNRTTVRAARERIAAALGAAAGALAAHPDPLAAIDRAVAGYFGVTAAALASKGRARTLREARQVAWALGHAGARQPVAALCRRYGGRRADSVARAVEAVGAGVAGGGAPARELVMLASLACADRSRRTTDPAPRSLAGAIRRRACLTCGEAFDSAGPHNRMCEACREEHDGEPDSFPVHISIEDWP